MNAAAARARERNRRAALGAGTALVARGLSLGLTLVTVPLTLGYLGPERYGMWLTVSSLIALLSFADMGIGYGLLNRLTRSVARGSHSSARIEVSTATTLLFGIAVLLGASFAAAFQHVSWSEVLAVTSPTAVAEAGPAVATFVAAFLIGIPLSVATQVRVARQEGFLVHIAAALGNVASLAALLLVIKLGAGVPALVAAMAAPPLVGVAANAVVLFVRDARHLRPTVRFADVGIAWNLIRGGFLFFVLQMSVVVAFATDRIVIAHIVGPEAVSGYGVTQTLFSVPMGLVAIVVTPLWPAYGDAVARRDVAWIRYAFRRSVTVAIAVTLPCGIALTLFGPWIVGTWVGGTIVPSFALLLGFSIWIVQGSVGHAVAMFLNGADEIRAQAVAAVVMASSNIALSIWLTTAIGVPGAIWGTVVTYGAFVLVPMAIYVPGVLRRVQADAHGSSQTTAASTT